MSESAACTRSDRARHRVALRMKGKKKNLFSDLFVGFDRLFVLWLCKHMPWKKHGFAFGKGLERVVFLDGVICDFLKVIAARFAVIFSLHENVPKKRISSCLSNSPFPVFHRQQGWTWLT